MYVSIFTSRKIVYIEVTERNKESLLKSILDTKDGHKHGYFSKCDLESPQNIHKKHKDFPLCPHLKTLEMKNCSDYLIEKKP